MIQTATINIKLASKRFYVNMYYFQTIYCIQYILHLKEFISEPWNLQGADYASYFSKLNTTL